MNITNFFYGPKLFKGFLAFILLSLLSTQSLAANYPLEIIQPRPSLDTKNRFYKAYPGLEYNVRLAVIGGEFPYRFELSSGPEGMTMDKRGEITWLNPKVSGVPYNVTATVTDAQSNTRSVSWTITVTTNGFRFIDAVNGKSVSQGGTGTISNPWKSMKDMYEGDDHAAKSASSYAGEFLYWRAGTYTMDAYKEDGGSRVPMSGNYKPQVWLAYPGETPVFDMSSAHLSIYSGGTNTYFDGLQFDINSNTKGMGVAIGSSASHVTFRNNKFSGIGNGYIGGNNSCIFITRDNVGSYYSIQDNELSNVNEGYGLLGYAASSVLVEDNTVHNIGGHPIGPKEGTRMWFIRSNHLYNNSRDSIGLQYSNSAGVNSGDIEISYNLVESGGGKVRINSNYTSSGYPVYIYRNTFLDEVDVNKVTSSNGEFSFYDNVIVNETSHPDKIERNSIENASRLIVTNNLTGRASDNIVDTQGYLTGEYSQYIGSRGHQIGARPLPPVVLPPVITK